MAETADELSSSSATSSHLLSLMSMSPTTITSPYAPFFRNLNADERGLFLIHLLLNCATHVAAGNIAQANTFLEHISLLSSPDGDNMQRIASYFTEALATRLLRSWPGLYRALNPILPESAAASNHGRRLFVDLFPFLRLSFLISNQAILEAMEGEKVVHVIDLGGSDPSHWLAFLQAVSGRPEGPPHLRITTVGEDRDFLAQTALVLTEEAEKLDIPFQFHAVVSQLEGLNIESLHVKTGEALAITSVLKLHSLLASDEATATPRQLFSPIAKIESFLASLRGLSPKLMVVTEQESNHNGANLNERFMEALNFYAALFDCLELSVPRQSAERLKVEKLVFREEIKNIIACEGLERKERHEKLDKWMRRLEMAGFGRVSLSYNGLVQARRMLQGFGCEGYKVKEENGCFLFCWQERALFSISAWRFRRYD
ncbi:scarecrow-like protein 3 [Dendrobium catenatum]|uniref:Scarecrow-like protein 3 n=1 Tax=Dendrobium catenatum TaxID=906689 RepID=A0A2I0XAA9_9ASPA|nr:scarecrow-like protein 3 [Dendrobium catenatum]PKU84830.1 Scarecrow-like protein 3 [Dendrobium catenatum]